VAKVIEYARVLETLTRAGFTSLYYNSGAFGFADADRVEIVGWMGPDDPSVRDEMRQHVRRVGEPYARSLSRQVRGAWEKLLLGKAWLMPKSHWAYELDFGNRDWLPDALKLVGVDAGILQPLTNAAAIEFERSTGEQLEEFLRTLFERLHGSDFMLAFPGDPALCTLHHHQQVWWQTTDVEAAKALR
jgi:hypothetical protein